jgi:hypothetical protein
MKDTLQSANYLFIAQIVAVPFDKPHHRICRNGKLCPQCHLTCISIERSDHRSAVRFQPDGFDAEVLIGPNVQGVRRPFGVGVNLDLRFPHLGFSSLPVFVGKLSLVL